MRLALAAVSVDDGCQIALFLRALADNLVERELVAGVEDRAVDCLAGKLEVLRSRSVCGVRAVIGRKHVREIFFFQLLKRHLGDQILHLNGDDLARLRHGKLLRVIGQIEAVAVDLGHQLLLFLVVIRIGHFLAVFIIILLQIHAFARHGVVVKIEGAEIAGCEAGNHCVIELVGVQRHCGRTGGNRNGSGSFVDLYDGVNLVGCALVRGLVDKGPDIRRVEIEARIEIDRVFAAACAQVVDHSGNGTAGPAIAHRFINRLLGVQRHLRDLRGQTQRPVRQDDVQGVAFIARLDRLGDCRHGSVPFKPSDIYARNIDVRVDGVLILEHKAIRADAQHDNCDQRQRDDPSFFAARLSGLLCGFIHLLLRHRGLLGRAALLKFTFLSDRNPSDLHRQVLPGIVLSGHVSQNGHYDNYHYTEVPVLLQRHFDQECRPNYEIILKICCRCESGSSGQQAAARA